MDFASDMASMSALESLHLVATNERLPAPVLRGSIRNQHVFDHPERSLRGRTITHGFHFEFPAGDLPSVKGGDDADKARWVPLSDALDMGPQLF